MTRDEVRAMSDEELDAKILDFVFPNVKPNLCMSINYATDLNGLRIAEQHLTPEQWFYYVMRLWDSAPQPPTEIAVLNNPIGTACLRGLYAGLTATARQRAEALLLTLREGDNNA